MVIEVALLKDNLSVEHFEGIWLEGKLLNEMRAFCRDGKARCDIRVMKYLGTQGRYV